jgi:hypothetical protein
MEKIIDIRPSSPAAQNERTAEDTTLWAEEDFVIKSWRN